QRRPSEIAPIRDLVAIGKPSKECEQLGGRVAVTRHLGLAEERVHPLEDRAPGFCLPTLDQALLRSHAPFPQDLSRAARRRTAPRSWKCTAVHVPLARSS